MKKSPSNRKKKFFNRKALLTSGALAFLAITFSLLHTTDKKLSALPHQNHIDEKISDYSATVMPKGAVGFNTELKDIAFENSPKRGFSWTDQVAAAIGSLKSVLPQKEMSKERGSWIWTPILNMTPSYIDGVVAGAKANGVNALYVSIDSYLDLFDIQNRPNRNELKNKFSDTLEYFIKTANRNGIQVDAEAGWQNWAEPGNEYKGAVVVNFVGEFNKTHDYKFRGFQYDVEPYLLERYQKDKVSVLKNFLSLIDKTSASIDQKLTFSVVAPDFYDTKDEFTPVFAYAGKEDSAFGHLLRIMDRRENGAIILMSYRNFAESSDGSIGVSQNEMDTANQKKRNTKIIIAQETGNFPPSYITFHGTSKEYMDQEISKINSAFASYPSFGGIAVHYINSYLAMK